MLVKLIYNSNLGIYILLILETYKMKDVQMQTEVLF